MPIAFLKPTSVIDASSNVASGVLTDIDEGVSAADANLMQSVANAWAVVTDRFIEFALEDLPGNAASINSVILRVRAEVGGGFIDDTTTYTWNITGTGMSGSVTWSDTDDGAGLANREVTTTGSPTVANVNAALIRVDQTAFNKVMSNDGLFHRWDCFELEVDYEEGGTPFIGIGIAGQYEWDGQVGLQSLGLDLEGVAGQYEWNGQVGLQSLGLDLEGIAGQYEWSGQVGLQSLGLDLEGVAGQYRWTGQLGQEVRGLLFEGVAGQYEWTGFIGGFNAGVDVPFIGEGVAGQYEWNGQTGLLELGLDLEGVAGAYEWSGQVGLQALGIDLEGVAGAYEWSGQIGQLVRGLSLEGVAGTYEWSGQPGQEVRGFNPLEGQTGLYEWTGFPGIFAPSTPVGNQINDCMQLSLDSLGFIGSRNDMLLEYYQANGATSDNIDDAEREFLLARGIAEAQVNDMWLAYFDARAFGTSTLNDGAFQFWCINGGVI